MPVLSYYPAGRVQVGCEFTDHALAAIRQRLAAEPLPEIRRDFENKLKSLVATYHSTCARIRGERQSQLAQLQTDLAKHQASAAQLASTAKQLEQSFQSFEAQKASADSADSTRRAQAVARDLQQGQEALNSVLEQTYYQYLDKINQLLADWKSLEFVSHHDYHLSHNTLRNQVSQWLNAPSLPVAPAPPAPALHL